jgi:hypothetical protein
VRAALAQVQAPGGERLTSGLGIANYPNDALTPDVLLHVADERLRISKGGQSAPATPAEAPATDRRFGQA